MLRTTPTPRTLVRDYAALRNTAIDWRVSVSAGHRLLRLVMLHVCVPLGCRLMVISPLDFRHCPHFTLPTYTYNKVELFPPSVHSARMAPGIRDRVGTIGLIGQHQQRRRHADGRANHPRWTYGCSRRPTPSLFRGRFGSFSERWHKLAGHE